MNELKLEILYTASKDLDEQIDYESLNNLIYQFERGMSDSEDRLPIQQLIPFIDSVLARIKNIHLHHWNPNQEQIIRGLGLQSIIGDRGVEYLNKVKEVLLNNTNSHVTTDVEIKRLIGGLRNLVTNPSNLLGVLSPFKIQETVLDDEEAIIEIIFDGGVSIENFGDAKEQMDDWFLIIEGYASILDLRREDFEIVAITKASPARFSLRTSIKAAVLVIDVFAGILSIVTGVHEISKFEELSTKSYILENEELRKQLQKAIAEKKEKDINEKIEQIVDEKIKTYNANVEKKSAIIKSIKNQFEFVNNGGTMNITIAGNDYNEKIQTLEAQKKQVQILQASENNYKQISEHSKSEDDEISNNSENETTKD